MSNGSPSGRLCLSCFYARQEQVDRRIAAKKARSPVRQLRVLRVKARDMERQRSILGADAGVALYLGAASLNLAAEGVVKQLAEAVEDPTSEFHREALALFAGRILPQKVYSNAGARLARSGALGAPSTGKPQPAPRFILNIGLTNGPKK